MNKTEAAANKLADELAGLVEGMQSGSEDAFSEFYSKSRGYVAGMIRSMDSQRANRDIDDIMQDVYIKVFEKIDTLNEPQSVMKWLGRITTTTTLNYLKKKEVAHEDVVTPAKDQTAEETLDMLNADFKVPEDFTENKALQDILTGEIKKLSQKQMYAFLEFTVNGTSVSEIAQALDMSEGAVKTSLSRTRKALQKEFLRMEKEEGIRLHSVSAAPFVLFIIWLISKAQPVSAAESAAVWEAVSASSEYAEAVKKSAAGKTGSDSCKERF